jgi:uncharacterized protein
VEYEWSEAKAVKNIKKHGVSFDEASTVFLDPLALSGRDPDHSDEEDRYVTFGHSSLGHLLSVCHTYRPGKIRIITARPATRSERKFYEEA